MNSQTELVPSDSKCQQAMCQWGMGTRRDRVSVSQPATCSSIFPFTKKNEARILYLQSLIVSRNTTNSLPSMLGAQKAARSHWGSPRFCMITRRRSWWPASSGSTAAEPPRKGRHSLGPGWAQLLWHHSCTGEGPLEGTGASGAAWEALRRKFPWSAPRESRKIHTSCWFLIGAAARGTNSS